MNMNFRIVTISFLICIVLAFTIPLTVQAAPDGRVLPDRIVAGGDFTLASGEVLTGNLVAFGGNILLEEGSNVNGDVLMFGGNIDISGEIKGDLLTFGGEVAIHNPAVIHGSVTQFGGTIEREPGAKIVGEVFTGLDHNFNWNNPPYVFFDTIPPAVRDLGFTFPFVFGVLWLLFVSLLMAALAIVIMLLFPKPTERIAHTAISQVVVSWGLGFLTALVLPFLLVLLVITIVMIPITLVGFLGMAVAMFIGWIAIGYEIGHRFDVQMHMHLSPPVAAGFGTFLLTLLTFAIVKLVPCLGWMLPFMIVFPLGLGAVLLTRFGTQVYPLEDAVRNGETDNQALAIPPSADVAEFTDSGKPTEMETPVKNSPEQPEDQGKP